MNTSRTCYLGGNTVRGFVSLYEDFIREEKSHYTYFIKGSAGSGKSTLMRRIREKAEECGTETEIILCSGDPDSLDGILLPSMGIAYLDATSPHVLEPSLPGITGEYVRLDNYRNHAELRKEAASLRHIHGLYKDRYARAYEKLHELEDRFPLREPTERRRAELCRMAERMAAELFSPGKVAAVPGKRFLSAMTRKGLISVPGVFDGFRCVLRTEGAPAEDSVFLSALSRDAAKAGSSVLQCLSPMFPELTEAVLIGTDIAVYHYDPLGAYPSLGEKLPIPGEASSVSEDDSEKIRSVLREAQLLLEEAGAYHDTLEELYRPYIDTAYLDALADTHISSLFGKE